MSDFEAFTGKAKRYSNAGTLSVTMSHGNLRLPNSVYYKFYDQVEHVEFLTDIENERLGINPDPENKNYSYKITEGNTVAVRKVLEYMGKQCPAENTMFELHVEEDEPPWIDVSKLDGIDE